MKDVTPVITLTLLHPLQSSPVQSWTFEPESVIRIGRSTDNDVILYSAVVSRHHVELRREGSLWEVVNLGANGTYLEGQRIEQASVVDGMIIRLASSGPKIQIRISATEPTNRVKTILGQHQSRKQGGSDKDTYLDGSAAAMTEIHPVKESSSSGL